MDGRRADNRIGRDSAARPANAILQTSLDDAGTRCERLQSPLGEGQKRLRLIDDRDARTFESLQYALRQPARPATQIDDHEPILGSNGS